MPEDKKFYELFEDKTISDVYKNIYDNATKTRNQVKGLIDQIKPFVKNLESSIIIVPLIREYMEILVRNDEHLIKLADSAIRLLKDGKAGGGEGEVLTEAEKKQILENAEEYVEEYGEYKRIEDENKKSIDERVDTIKEEFLGEEVVFSSEGEKVGEEK